MSNYRLSCEGYLNVYPVTLDGTCGRTRCPLIPLRLDTSTLTDGTTRSLDSRTVTYKRHERLRTTGPRPGLNHRDVPPGGHGRFVPPLLATKVLQ